MTLQELATRLRSAGASLHLHAHHGLWEVVLVQRGRTLVRCHPSLETALEDALGGLQ